MTGRIGEQLAAVWRRAVDLGHPEVGLGVAIIAGWTVAAVGPLVPIPVTVVAVAAVVGLHLAAVDTGSFTLLWLATGTVVALISVTARAGLGGLDPVVLTVAGSTALAHNETIRVGYGRRRGASVDRAIFTGSAGGVGLAGLVAVVAVGIAGPLADDPSDRSWLWMPLAVAVVVALLVGFTVGPTWRAPEATRERWQPGDRLPRHHGHHRP